MSNTEIFNEIVLPDEPHYDAKNNIVVIHRDQDSLKEVLVEFDFSTVVVYSLAMLKFWDGQYFLVVESYYDMDSLNSGINPIKTLKLSFDQHKFDYMCEMYDEHICTIH